MAMAVYAASNVAELVKLLPQERFVQHAGRPERAIRRLRNG